MGSEEIQSTFHIVGHKIFELCWFHYAVLTGPSAGYKTKKLTLLTHSTLVQRANGSIRSLEDPGQRFTKRGCTS